MDRFCVLLSDGITVLILSVINDSGLVKRNMNDISNAYDKYK